MRTLNIRERDTQGQIQPVFDPYRNSLDNVIDNNIDDEILDRNNLPRPTKPNTSVF